MMLLVHAASSLFWAQSQIWLLAADCTLTLQSGSRRYPDLLVHRMIRDYGRSKEIAEHFEQVIPEIATRSSNRSVVPSRLEREVEAMKKLSTWKYVGERVRCIVSSIVRKLVSLLNCQTQSKAWFITNLPEFYHFNERDLTLRGEKSNNLPCRSADSHSSWKSR